MVHALVALFAMCGVQGPVVREDRACFRQQAMQGLRGTEREPRMDITLMPGAVRGARDPAIRDKHLLIDVTMRQPCAESSIRALRTHRIAGAAAAKGESDKVNTYSAVIDPVTSTLIAFAVETFGRLGSQAERLVRELALHCADRACGPFGEGVAAAGAAVRSRTVALIRQRVSVALQTAVSMREIAFERRVGVGAREQQLEWRELGG
jgi:hypothetical protein